MVFSSQYSRDALFCYFIEARPHKWSEEGSGQGNTIPTSDFLSDLNDLRVRESIAADPTVDRPFPVVLHCSSNDGGEVGSRGRCHDGVFVPSNHDCSFVLHIEYGLEWLDVLGCLVWEGKIVEEDAGLE